MSSHILETSESMTESWSPKPYSELSITEPLREPRCESFPRDSVLLIPGFLRLIALYKPSFCHSKALGKGIKGSLI